MFNENKLKVTKKDKKTFKFDLFNKCPIGDRNEEEMTYSEPTLCYNFKVTKCGLENGYGVKDLQMPLSTTDLETEAVVPINGNEVRRMWSFTWEDNNANVLKYYLFYFNENHQINYENMFWTRPIRISFDTEYTSTPVGLSYRINGYDYMIFSTQDGDVYVFGAGYDKYLEGAPKLISCCTHDDRLYALTSKARHSLVYSTNLNIMEWKDDTTQHLEFSDERGNLTKVMSFNDYLYVFREFGITRVSTYSTSGEFSIRHMFQSTSYIHTGSIASNGEDVYFLTTEGFYSFDGNSVKEVALDCFSQIEDLSKCSAECFENKYYLACRMKFDERSEGCESGEYINNAVLIYDTKKEEVEILRGVDVNQLLALNNPLKSKLVMCFNGDMVGHVGELSCEGTSFGQSQHKVWRNSFSDFDLGEGVKKVEHFEIKTSAPCKVTLESEKENRVYNLKGSERAKLVKSGLIGKRVRVTIESDSDKIKISSFKLILSVQ